MQLLTSILDWCFPPRSDERHVRTLHVADITLVPTYPQPHTTCLLPFAHPSVSALIHEAKFHHNQRAHWLLGSVVGSYLTQHFPTASLVPIPLHPVRERKRGFNQVTACLRSDPTLRTQLNTNILKRIRHTKPQTELSAEERSRNVAHAFVARARVRATIDPEQPIVIIDDVYTTGATMRAARTAMRTAFPHHTIHCLTFAYA